jgi:hypothetical protein
MLAPASTQEWPKILRQDEKFLFTSQREPKPLESVPCRAFPIPSMYREKVDPMSPEHEPRLLELRIDQTILP